MARLPMMLLAVSLSVSVSATGCVTTAGIVKKQDVSLPILIGAAVVDLVVTTAAASQIQDISSGGALVTGLSLTAVDVAIGCLVGACSSLKL